MSAPANLGAASSRGSAFAGYLARPLATPAIVLYASVTGQSEDVATEITKRWTTALPTKPIELLSTEQLMAPQTNLDLLPKLKLIIAVMSTTGNGEEPDMARKFLRELRKKGKGFLTGVKVVICALGDSNYSQFCEAGMKLRRLLLTAGVEEMMPVTKIDEVTAETDLPKFFEAFEKNILKHPDIVQEGTPNTTDAATQDATPAAVPTAEESKKSDDAAAVTPAAASVDGAVAPVSVTPVASAPVDSAPATAAATAPADPAPSKPSDTPAHALHPSNSVPVKMADMSLAAAPATATAAKKGENQIVWLDQNTSAIPSYYQSRWGNLDSRSERSSCGTESESPAFATLHGAQYLTTPDCHAAGRTVVHMELEIPRGTHAFTYKPGDAVGIYCANDPILVDALLTRLNVSSDSRRRLFTHSLSGDPKWSHLPSPCSLIDAFLYGVDLASSKSWKKIFFATLAKSTTDQQQRKELFALAGRNEEDKLVKPERGVKTPYDSLIIAHNPTLLDLLNQFPSCQPSVETLLLSLPPLLPRSYSLSSSQTHDAGIMSIAWSKVAYTSSINGAQREGVCTKWLHDLCQMAGFLPKDAAAAAGAVSSDVAFGGFRQDKDGRYQIPVFRKHSAYFALPEDMAWAQPATKDSLPARPQSVPVGLASLSHAVSSSDSAVGARVSRPVIMVGPGTGVAPFRGFLQQRLAHRIARESDPTDCCCDGEWRTMDHLAAPPATKTTCQTQPNTTLRPPMCNADGTITAANQINVQTSTAAVAQPASPPVTKALGHYDTPDVVFDDTYTECDSRFGGGVVSSSSSPSSALLSGPMYLFFGCRRSDWDYLYANDFAHFVEKEVLTQLSVAFSREETNNTPNEKFYVQHRMRLHGAQIADLLLHQDAYLYVCGDGVRMANDVTACVKTILQEHGGKTQAEADALVMEWKNRLGKEPRYIEDIWA